MGYAQDQTEKAAADVPWLEGGSSRDSRGIQYV